jgi:Zn-dependent protease with chaperone function
LLTRGWAIRAPRLALSLWLTLGASWISAAALALLAAIGHVPLSWSTATAGAGAGTWSGHRGVAGLAVAALGTLLAFIVIARPIGCVVLGMVGAGRERRALAAHLSAAGRLDQSLGVIVLDDDVPTAYCLSGRRPSVVISTGALSVLDHRQLPAVLTHERAHLRGRHHVLVAAAWGLSRAFPFVPLLARAGRETAMLAEMAADDAAASVHTASDLAAALVVLATGQRNPAVLAAGGPAAVARIQRLLAPHSKWRPAAVSRRVLGTAAFVVGLTMTGLPLIVFTCAFA